MVCTYVFQYDKYLKLYNDIKSKKGIEPNNFVFARNLAGKKAVFIFKAYSLLLIKYGKYREIGILEIFEKIYII